MVTKDLGAGFHIYTAGQSLLGPTPVWRVLVYTHHLGSITKQALVCVILTGPDTKWALIIIALQVVYGTFILSVISYPLG